MSDNDLSVKMEKMLINVDDCDITKDDRSIIRCIFFSEFHPIAGPKITCQVPDNYVSKDIFDNVSVYIIPKAQLQRSTITVTLRDCKILGFPVKIDDNKYARNAFYFNLCFVCDAEARTAHYEPIVKKMSDFLMALEMENCFLSTSCDDDKKRLTKMLRQVMDDLNCHRISIVTEGTMTTHLKVVRTAAEPSLAVDYEVPIFLEDKNNYCTEQWDLTTLEILKYIDGFNHISKIASEADVDISLVKTAVQNLVFYGVAKTIPIFQYCNVYATTSKIKELSDNEYLQKCCIAYSSINLNQPALFRDCYRMYANMKHGISMKILCERLQPNKMGINEKKLVQFGLIAGIIRRIYKFPIYEKNEDEEPRKDSIYRYFNGTFSLDEICCFTGMPTIDVENIIEADSNVFILWK